MSIEHIIRGFVTQWWRGSLESYENLNPYGVFIGFVSGLKWLEPIWAWVT